MSMMICALLCLTAYATAETGFWCYKPYEYEAWML